jgi:DNA-directed RNA polymerase specialized sigma24 family protein
VNGVELAAWLSAQHDVCMTFNSDPTTFDRLFSLLEPEALSVDEGAQRCRLKLVKFFGWRRCEDPESLANETISRLLKNISEGQQISADHPYSYVYAIAKNVFKEFLREKKRRSTIADVDGMGEIPAPDQVADCRRWCLAQLSAAKIEVLASYYLDDVDRCEIAERQGLTINALRLQVHRYKRGLRRCLADCLKRGDRIRN